MLKLKKLQILGFKSFCDRTELKFHGEGIAAIVGPNGCGKSNLSDAISWVLGEQSAKTLRGARMEDVIFAGTRDRKPTGMAEVSLTLIDPEVYDGPAKLLSTETEIEIREEMPQEDDWDEAELRAHAAAETERVSTELQPGQLDDEPGHEGEAAAMPEAPDAAPASVAEGAASLSPVVLKIRRRRLKPQQFHAGEIVITRRLFRTGDSEYLLNGKLCRLRDIQELFMGTGLGPESYAIIEQGRIGQILSSKPHDRRAVIEEAAGITKFKTKKRLAEARLEQAKLNLARVHDIFEEVTRQMNSLKRQASKAERYARLREEMRAKLRVVLASRFVQMDADAARLNAEIAALTADLAQRTESVQRLETEHAERTQRGYAVEDEARTHAERTNALTLEMDRAQDRRRHNDERCAELASRTEVQNAELARTEAHHVELAGELENNRALLDSAAALVAEAQRESLQRQHEAACATDAVAEAERLQEQRRVWIMESVAQAAGVRNHAAQAEERLTTLDRDATRISAELASARAQLDSFGGQRGQLALEFESASQSVAALTSQIVGTRERLDKTRADERASREHLDSLRAEFATALGKRNSLEAVIAEHGYSTESVKRLFQSGTLQSGFAPAGVLADFLEVEHRYEGVVEDFLRDELNYVVVKSWDAADEGLRLLRSDVDGRATFLVHPEDSQAKFSFVVDESTRQESWRNTIVPLKNCIRVLNGFGKSLEVILPKLRDGYITPDPAIARNLALENPDAFFLSASGECFHNVTVTGGKQRSEGPLSMKRELRDVARQLEEVGRALREEERRAATLSKDIGELTSLLDRLETEKREAEKQAMTSGHTLRQLESELDRARQRSEVQQSELQRLRGERAETLAGLEEKRVLIAAHETRRTELEREAAAAQEQMLAFRSARETAAQTAAEASARVAALEERRAGAAAAMARIESLAAEVAGRVAELRSQLQAAVEETARRTAENATLAEQLVAQEAERVTLAERAATLHAESEALRARLIAIEQELRATRQEMDAARDRKGELAATLARLHSDVDHLATTCLNELGVARDALAADDTILPLAGDALDLEDAQYREMRARLEAMGPVNMMALEEYNETAQRHAFLESQRQDLLESIENTQNTIREIDTFSRQKFQEAFDRINENFQFAFRKLFGGGQAFMRLTDEENTAESGIDVVASPPGKKLQNVLLLSGGEKALTALSLLVGIFQYQPAPFCILDEVDAPLDEANIGRFTELVREMSVQTQFVLITHNKKTMSIAPVMYGVTMQEPGVSKLVSVRFGEAQAAASA